MKFSSLKKALLNRFCTRGSRHQNNGLATS